MSTKIGDRRLSNEPRPGERGETQKRRDKSKEVICDLVIPYDEENLKFYTLNLLLGHPDRPVLFLLTDTEPEDANITSADGWYYVYYRTPYVLWWTDSPIEAFNTWTKLALKEIGAEEYDKEKIQGKDRIIYKFKTPLKAGIIEDTAEVYAIFAEADAAAADQEGVQS